MSKDFDDALEGLAQGPEATDAAAGAEGDVESDAAAHPSVGALRERFGEAILRWEVVAGDEYVVFVVPERAREVLAWLKADGGQRYDFLADLTAVDFGGGRPLQVVYQLWSNEHKRQLRVKAEVPLRSLEIESVVPLWRTADWLERETYDLFGINFPGHPDLRRIMMPENYQEGHPLRKDFPLRGRFTRAEQTRQALSSRIEDYYIPQELEFMRKAGQPIPDPHESSGMTSDAPAGGFTKG
jgi:NADH-quinone oxidoreductase subunit C